MVEHVARIALSSVTCMRSVALFCDLHSTRIGNNSRNGCNLVWLIIVHDKRKELLTEPKSRKLPLHWLHQFCRLQPCFILNVGSTFLTEKMGQGMSRDIQKVGHNLKIGSVLRNLWLYPRMQSAHKQISSRCNDFSCQSLFHRTLIFKLIQI